MAQQTINTGNSINDHTGDQLRTAFNKINSNFDELYSAGPVTSQVQIANNVISTTVTNANLVLNPNGVGVVQTNNSIKPGLTLTYDIGSNTHSYRTVYANNYCYPNGVSAVNQISYTTNSPGPGGANQSSAVALRLDRSIQKLVSGWYSLANGSEGQIMYFVTAATANVANVIVNFSNARFNMNSETAYTGPDFSYVFATASGSPTYVSMVTAVFADGCWMTNPDGQWD
jgi:hypothetical protein